MAAPGWYPDPENRDGTERYWDGNTWLDTRSTTAAPQSGWYPDPHGQPGIERFWDGERWWNTRTTPSSLPPRPDLAPASGNGAERFVVRILVRLGLGAILSIVGLFAAQSRTTESKPRWTEQECVQAVLDELIAVRSEVEFPTMTDWSVDRELNPLLDAALTSEERCGPGSRTIRGFDWSKVQEDMNSLRAHLRWDRERPTLEDLTPVSEIEAHLD